MVQECEIPEASGNGDECKTLVSIQYAVCEPDLPSFTVCRPSSIYVRSPFAEYSPSLHKRKLHRATGGKNEAVLSYLPWSISAGHLSAKKGHGFPHDPLGRDHYLSVLTKDTYATLVLVGFGLTRCGCEQGAVSHPPSPNVATERALISIGHS